MPFVSVNGFLQPNIPRTLSAQADEFKPFPPGHAQPSDAAQYMWGRPGLPFPNTPFLSMPDEPMGTMHQGFRTPLEHKREMTRNLGLHDPSQLEQFLPQSQQGYDVSMSCLLYTSPSPRD